MGHHAAYGSGASGEVKCPNCGVDREHKVSNTYELEGEIKRTRTCFLCHTKWRTLEVIISNSLSRRIGERVDYKNARRRGKEIKSAYLLGNRSTQPEIQKAVVACLVDHAHRATTYRELAEEVWLDGQTSINTIKANVSLIRKFLGAESIKTVRGVGYQWAGRIGD